MIEKSLLWDITYYCNLRCQHCYNAEKIASAENNYLLQNYSAQFVVRRIKELGINHVHLLGGEPFCSPEFLHIIKECNEQNVLVSINTNGSLLNQQMIEKLFHYQIDQITISLDGATKEKNDMVRGNGSFDLTVKNVTDLNKYIKENKLSTIIQIATVVTKGNMEDIFEMPRLVRKTGCKYLSILKLFECGNGAKNSRVLAISDEEYINVIKQVLVKSFMNQIYTNVDCKPLVLDKLCDEFGFGFGNPASFAKCQAAHSIYYMDAYGQFFPCGPCSQDAMTRKKFNHYIYEDNFVKEVSLYRTVIEKMLSTNQKVDDELCNKCKYMNECSVCAICDFDNSLCRFVGC